MMKLKYLAMGLLIAAPTFAAKPPQSSWLMDKIEKGKVEFLAVGRPSMLKIHGIGSAPTGQFQIEGNKLVGSTSFDLSSLETGISLRDKHMKDKYLETERFPKATLTLDGVSLPPNAKLPGSFMLEKIPFSGKLDLHGVKRTVEGLASIQGSGATTTVKAEFSLKIKDFSIAEPGFAGITMADEVTILVELAGPLVTKQDL
jgi:polyisoprenoid-binding protein YceI